MSRLTERDKSLSECCAFDELDAFDKLQEYEDFMEKYNIENMEDLELRLEDVEHYAYNCNVEQIDEIIKLKQENQALKDRWEELKGWIDYCSSGCLDYDEILQKMKELEEEN